MPIIVETDRIYIRTQSYLNMWHVHAEYVLAHT